MNKKSIATLAIATVLSFTLFSCPYSPGPSTPAKGNLMRLEAVARNLNRPLFVTSPPGDTARRFIVEQRGRILLQKGDEVLGVPFLDLSALVSPGGGERGLLGLAFHPDYAGNGRLYVSYTDLNGDSVIALYCAYADDPDKGDPATAEILLTITQPYTNHNGGMLAFGPDGYLYIGSGDGGSGNDPDNNAQSLDTLLGKILRIEVGNHPGYTVPTDNPFVNTEGVLPEIWAYGLRNPWRFSFDRATGDLWIGDVGQSALEEINFQRSTSLGGENYGWRNREGTICRPNESECDLPDATDPIHAYGNLISQSITGGYVYRGAAVPSLQGTYFFADYVSGKVYALTHEDGGNVMVTDETESLNTGGVTLSNIASFGEGADGEMYIVDYGAGILYKLVAA